MSYLTLLNSELEKSGLPSLLPYRREVSDFRVSRRRLRSIPLLAEDRLNFNYMGLRISSHPILALEELIQEEHIDAMILSSSKSHNNKIFGGKSSVSISAKEYVFFLGEELTKFQRFSLNAELNDGSEVMRRIYAGADWRYAFQEVTPGDEDEGIGSFGDDDDLNAVSLEAGMRQLVLEAEDIIREEGLVIGE